MASTFEYSKGNMDVQEYKYHITRDVIISVSSIVGGSIAVAVLPFANAISFMIGSMIGSVLASVSISMGEKILVSFCVDTGYTLFGLVKQDYQLPEAVLKNLGFNMAQLNNASVNKVNISRATLNRASFRKAELNRVDIIILKRGIISFNKVGYSNI